MKKARIFILLGIFVASTALITAIVGSPGPTPPNGADQLIAGRNVNMVSGSDMPEGDPYLQRQNEPSVAVSTRNPLHLLAGSNDYRTINIPFLDELPGTEHESSIPDAWLGVYKSIDGGETWKSTLLPGFPQDTTPLGMNSPLWGYGTAADPVVRSGPNGLFFYSGIAFNRENRGLGVVFVSRFIDNNFRENIETIDYLDTKIIDQGNAGQFIDKPWIAVDVPYDEPPSITLPAPADPLTGLPQTQTVARTNVYMAYSTFLGNTEVSTQSRIMFVRSTDSGKTWGRPIKLSEGEHVCQGAVIGIDPSGNGHVYVVWRRFATPSQADAIILAKSTDGGATFSKPIVVHEFASSSIAQPQEHGVFDQVTTYKSFRTNDYPTMAVDNAGNIFIAWSLRGLGPTFNPLTEGESRIVITASTDGGFTWSAPIEAISHMDDEYKPGHQVMPSITYAAGKLTLIWYDQRWDLLPLFEELYIEDSIAWGQRHTIDVRLAQLPVDTSIPSLVFDKSIQVSRYPFMLIPNPPDAEPPITAWKAVQLVHNMPNLPLFARGTVPFMGDYIDIASSPHLIYDDGTDRWIYNTDPNNPTVYHAVWTDNRDVAPPGVDFNHDPEDWFNNSDFENYNAPGGDCLDPSRSGVLNQNIYTSRISKGILTGSPGNTKPLNMIRSFVVFVKNMTGEIKNYDLDILAPASVQAFFYDPTNPDVWTTTTANVDVFPYSYTQKTVMVANNNDQWAQIKIEVSEGNTLISTITLNPDPENPWIDSPDDADPTSPHIRNEGETHTPHIRNTTIIDWTYEDVNPNITTVLPETLEDSVNPDGVTPYSADEVTQNPHIRNPHIRNPHIRNPHIRNPHIRNNALNPHIRNESFPDDIPGDSHMTDVLWALSNDGNTTSTFSLDTYDSPTDIPDGVLVQMIIFKTYTTPAAAGCDLVDVEHQEVISSFQTPHIRNAGFLPEVSVDLKPNEECYVLYRFYNPYQSQEQQDFYDDKEYLNSSVPDIEPEIPNTDPTNKDQLEEAPPPPVGMPVIPPQSLPDGVTGQAYPSTSLIVEGGTAPFTWALDAATSLPDHLSFHPDGIIDGIPSEAGDYSFIVEVTDSSIPPHTSRQSLSIHVVDPVTIATSSLTLGAVNVPYSEVLLADGGDPPYSWSVTSGALPPGLSLDGNTGEIAGAPDYNEIAEYPQLYDFDVNVIDEDGRTSTASLNITVVLGVSYPSLPDPVLEYVDKEDMGGYTYYNFTVANYEDYPDEIFAEAPYLPPCGSNPDASRTWVDFYDDQANNLYGFCAITENDSLTGLWFALPEGTTPPPYVYIEIVDRLFGLTLTSNQVTIDGPPPSGDKYFAYVTNFGSHNVYAYSIDSTTGAMTEIAGSPFATGDYPRGIAIDPSGRFAYVANQVSDNVSAYSIDSTTGALTEVAGSPFAAGHIAYAVAVNPSGKFVYVANYGSNNISAYSIDIMTGVLTEVAGSPFAAGVYPRGIAFDPSGTFAYVANQGSLDVSSYTIDSTTGALTEVAGSPFSTGDHPSDIAIDPSGRFAYVANYLSDNISAYSIDSMTGALTEVGGSPFAAGEYPHKIAIDFSGKFAYVANIDSNNVSAFSIDSTTGALTEVAGSPFAAGEGPTRITIDPSESFVYVNNHGSNNISSYSINPTTGVLTEIAGSPFAAGVNPTWVAIVRIEPTGIATIYCTANNGGFLIDGTNLTTLQQGESTQIIVKEGGSQVELWSCEPCQWIPYQVFPNEIWEIRHVGPGPVINLINISALWKCTPDYYPETADLDVIVNDLFGPFYRVADWNDLVAYSATHSIVEWADDIGMQPGYPNGFLVTWNGEHYWGGTNRHYWIDRHDHQVPGGWLVHATIDNNFIDLGSWYNMNLRILCIRKF